MTTTKAKNEDTTRRHFGRGEEGLRKAREYFAAVRGRPRKGETAVGTSTRSLRLPDPTWVELERKAAELGVPLHQLVRRVIADWLYTSATVTPRSAVKASKRAKGTVAAAPSNDHEATPKRRRKSA